MNCSEEYIIKFLGNDLTEQEKAEFLNHIETCSSCRDAVSEMKELDSVLADHFEEIEKDAENIPLKDNFNATVIHSIELSRSPSAKLIVNFFKFVLLPGICIGLFIVLSTFITDHKKKNEQPQFVEISVFGSLKKRSGYTKIFHDGAWSSVDELTPVALSDRIRTERATDCELHIFDGSFVQLLGDCELYIKNSQTIVHEKGDGVYKIFPSQKPINVVFEHGTISGETFSISIKDQKIKIHCISSYLTITAHNGNVQKLLSGYYTVIENGHIPSPVILYREEENNEKSAEEKKQLQIDIPENMSAEELFEYLKNKKIDEN